MIAHNTQPVIQREGFKLIRFLLVLGSLSPLFLLLWIRGVPTVNGHPIFSDWIYSIICLSFIVVPNAVLKLKIDRAGQNHDTKVLTVGSSTDHRDHLIAYLFALVIPLYQNNYNSLRDVFAALVLLVVIVFLFMHLNLHYMNPVFALLGYRVYTIETEDDKNSFSGRCPFILITKRHSLYHQQKITARRISNTVFFEY